MLFMGEEYAASTPFLYFCDFDGELAKAVTEGRRAEFGRFARFADPSVRERIPDPNAPDTFATSKLQWAERHTGRHAGWLALYSRLLRQRQRQLVPWLAGASSGRFDEPAPGSLRIAWPLGSGRVWHLLAQLADHAGDAALVAALPGDVVYASHRGDALEAWSVGFTLQAA
jgi:1,4-alpha-glucan branching enzyme